MLSFGFVEQCIIYIKNPKTAVAITILSILIKRSYVQLNT